MEIEDKLLKLVDVDNDECDENGKEEIKGFLQKLKHYKVENLRKEVQRIKETVSSLNLKIQESAFENYQAFINSSKSSRTVLQKWNMVRVDTLVDEIPSFTSSCDDFFKKSYQLELISTALNLTVEKNNEILNVLKLPQLMELSIQQENYENALELASYVQKLNTKLPNAVLIESVISTIEASWYVMISQLLMELRCDELSLTKCLNTVGFLRRMQAFSLTELKIKFLQERGLWFENSLTKIPRTDAYQYLIRNVEITRVSLFNIITQYKALFDDDYSTMKEGEKNSHLIINGWVQDRIENFLRNLESNLLNNNNNNNNLNVTDIVAIIGQCMYFGSSFSRIGFDFRAEIAPIFIRALSKSAQSAINEMTREFENEMETFTLINRDMKLTSVVADRDDDESDSKVNNQPPETILDFYPLASYTNKLLILFNELRIYFPLACAKDLLSTLNASLDGLTRSILSFFKNEQQAFNKKEQENFLKLCNCFCFDFLPYIQQCIYQIFQKQNFSLIQSANIETLLILSKEPFEKLLHLGTEKSV